ncbi:cation-transporting P-type ATPase [Nocardiopsis sp. MT53]|uniref:Cation-transporting P-type ATPase n=1 Tax=Nocardiopsis changdeensis TaxID=2831969 RepID=A0ABX8BVH6_9ACTN|nr:cation-transporting P-type ATPase [Nocardiopsis changdeensis]QYX40538.1 cation-transporting P-type ATPase [Nocardiopsis sp. MT53]
MHGLTSAEAAERLGRDGPNVLPSARRSPPVVLLLHEITHFFAVLLWIAALLAVVGGMPQLGLAIMVVVLVNGGFAFVQEYRADRAGQRLREMMPATALVVRDGTRRPVDVTALVRDDLVVLRSGSRVPADMRLVRTHGLAVDESPLTGESAPVRPGEGGGVHAGTYVVEGEAEGVVTATAGHTRLGGIAALSRQARRPPSPLSVQLRRVVSVISGIAAGVAVVFFAISLLLGAGASEGFLLSVGVAVALVPEGLLPTVTLSLARAAHRMARSRALVRHLESVETLGSATFICTDKTGTLTRNEMEVVRVWTPSGTVHIRGGGYGPRAEVSGGEEQMRAARLLAQAAALSSPNGVRLVEGHHRPVGDPMEAALHALAARTGADAAEAVDRYFPFDPRRRLSSAVVGDQVYVKGAPDALLPRCGPVRAAEAALTSMTGRGLRVLAVARRRIDHMPQEPREAENGLVLLGMVGLEDPPRDGVRDAIARCRTAGVRVAMVTGDHPGTALAIAREVGLVRGTPLVATGSSLPDDERDLGRLLDHDGAVLARVTPEDKLRITAALQRRGHVVAMTGDGVNDGPALRRADIGVAMGASGTDVAREASDLVLLDDHFATIVAAIELGRSTFANIRRFLTYHLVDNVAELTPFLAWAASGGDFPLALGVLQILALDIGTDLLPALALGAEPPSSRTMTTGPPRGALIDRKVVIRVFGVLGPVEAAAALGAFTAVLWSGGWRWGLDPGPELLTTASGTAFATVVLGQMAVALACRSESTPVVSLSPRTNPMLGWAIATGIISLGIFLVVPPFPALLGGTLPPPLGWAAAVCAVPALVLADLVHKRVATARSIEKSVRPGRT